MTFYDFGKKYYVKQGCKYNSDIIQKIFLFPCFDYIGLIPFFDSIPSVYFQGLRYILTIYWSINKILY